MSSFTEYDSEYYKQFTFPMELDKAIHILEGIIKGITIDDILRPQEIEMLKNWCAQYRPASKRHPFRELLPLLDLSLQDNVLSKEEKEDILWFCHRFSTKNSYFDVVTADMQRLQGMLAGIVADGKIEEEELRKLSVWLNDHENLKTCWPYEEICSLITSVMSDQKIDAKEHEFLLAFFSEFMSSSANLLLQCEVNGDLTQQGICAVCPEIDFENRTFCFTGKSSKASRKELAKIVTDLHGIVSPDMKKDVNYLIIGAEGNNCWAFSCYGRKVEEAMTLRKKGTPIQLVHENDFWDAVQDVKH